MNPKAQCTVRLTHQCLCKISVVLAEHKCPSCNQRDKGMQLAAVL